MPFVIKRREREREREKRREEERRKKEDLEKRERELKKKEEEFEEMKKKDIARLKNWKRTFIEERECFNYEAKEKGKFLENIRKIIYYKKISINFKKTSR